MSDELTIARVVPEIEVDVPPQSEIERLRVEVERLRAIVDQLPKTADDVPVVPGMVLWPLHELEDEEGGTVFTAIHDNASGDIMTLGDEASAEKCYSTREAAEAARAAGGW